jgi:hypothetical protein
MTPTGVSPLNAPLAVAVRLAESANAEHLYEWVRLAAGEPPKPSLVSNATRRNVRFSPILLRALVARGNRLIDLAVATYGDDHDVLRELWERGDETIRLAMASNRHRGGLTGLDLMDLLRSNNRELIALALTNPSMSSPAMARILAREEPLAQLSDDEWRVGAAAVARSPVIRLTRRLEGGLASDHGLDPWDEMKSQEVFNAAWRLPHDLDPTEANAELLEALLAAAADFSPPVFDYGYEPTTNSSMEGLEQFREAQARFVTAMLQKWRRENTPGGASPLGEFQPDYHRGARVVISEAAAKAGLLDDEPWVSDDPAIRMGYHHEGREWTADKIRAGFDRDGEDFLRDIVGNEVVHRQPELAKAVRRCLGILDSFETRLELERTWHSVGMALWRKDRVLYPDPNQTSTFEDREPTDSLGLEEALERIADRTRDSFASDLARLKDAEMAGDISHIHAARFSVDAALRLSNAILTALKRVAEELEVEKRHRSQANAMASAVRRALWVLTTVVIITFVVGKIRRWL